MRPFTVEETVEYVVDADDGDDALLRFDLMSAEERDALRSYSERELVERDD